MNDVIPKDAGESGVGGARGQVGPPLLSWKPYTNYHVTLHLVCILHFHLAVEGRTMWIKW